MAVNSHEASKWQKAVKDEIRNSPSDNDTYDLVTPLEGRQIVGGGEGEWVYAVKNVPNGEETYNARYAAKG